MADPSRSGLICLESDVSEGAASKSTPRPRNLGKGPGLKPPSARPEARQEEAPEQAEEDPILPPPLSYNPDRDKLGDANFNLFRGGEETRNRRSGPAAAGTHLGRARYFQAPLDDTPAP